MNLTLRLLKAIGSPLMGVDNGSSDEVDESLELNDHAVNNKVAMLYLEALKRRGKLERLQPQYDEEFAKCANFFEATAKVSRVLKGASVEHAIFKSIKPYPGRGGDVDVLVFDPKAQYRRAVAALLKADYVSVLPQFREMPVPTDELRLDRFVKLLTTPTFGRYGHISPTGTDLLDDEHGGILIDLQKDVAVSHVVYLDKGKLSRHTNKTSLPNGPQVDTLTPEAELVAVIAHSFAEQMFLLGEFYTFLFYLSAMDESGMHRFIEFSEENRITGATRVFATLTARLHRAAYGSVPQKLEFILGELGADAAKGRNLEQDDFAMPQECLQDTGRSGVGPIQVRDQINYRIVDITVTNDILAAHHRQLDTPQRHNVCSR